MDFELSDERKMLADTATRLIRTSYPIATRHAHAAREGGFDRAMWRQFADLGLVGALIPPEAGGYGGVGDDIAVVFEQIGRGLVVEPFLASGVLGAGPLALAGSDGQRAMVEQVVAGDTLLAFAHGEPQSRYEMFDVATRAERSGDGWRLSGRKAVVLNGDTADAFVVSARVAGGQSERDGLALFVVPANTAGLTRRGYDTIDGLRAAEVALDDAVVDLDAAIGEPGTAGDLIETTIARGVVALCAEAIGLMDVSRDMTLEYLKTRTQFGRPIGAFQVLQHRMVDVTLEIEQARSLTMLAASALAAARVERERAVSAAKNLVGRVGRLVAEETIQLHGGIAMTWEYALPHYAKRLTMVDHQLGDTDFHLARFIALGRAR